MAGLPDNRIQMKLLASSILTLPDNSIKPLSFMKLLASSILSLPDNRMNGTVLLLGSCFL
jgi:hypothetical protein